MNWSPAAPKTHGRFAYSAITRRPAWRWPNGARLAVYIGFNVEHFAFGEGLGANLAPPTPQPDVLNFAWREYGNRVGVWRLIDLFDEIGTFLTRSPRTVETPRYSILSFSGVEVPCALT